MAKKIRSWHFWDWKTIKRASVFIICGLLVIIAFAKGSRILDSINASEMNMETTALLISIIPVQQISQTRFGNSIQVRMYKVKYEYMIGSTTYIGLDNIQNSNQNRAFIKYLMNNKASPIKIRYDENEHQSSQIIK